MRPPQIEITEPDSEPDIDLNESADLFLEESRWSTTATRGDSQSSTVSCTDSSACSISRDRTAGTKSPKNFVSSLLLLPFPPETRSPDGIRSNREMASPPCMANGNLSKGPVAVWTGDNSVEETTTAQRTQDEHVEDENGHIYTGNGKSNTETSNSNLTKETRKPS